MTDYTDYTVRVSTDPAYYGTYCSYQDASRIAKRLTSLIEGQFPGIATIQESEIGGRGVTGPDQSVIDDITYWISANWTRALQ